MGTQEKNGQKHSDPPPAFVLYPPGGKLWRAGTLTYTTVGLILLSFWLLWGDFAFYFKERSVPSVLQLLLKKFEASDTLTGVLIASLPGIIGIVLGPIVSYRSDRHRGRWGRRIPYLLLATPLAVVAMIAMAFGPGLGRSLHAWLGVHSPGLNASTLAVFALGWTIFEFSSVTANAVFGGLINDVVPAAVLGRFYGAFRALSLVAGIIFNFYVLAEAEAHYTGIFLGVALLYGLGFTVMCLGVREGQYEPTPVSVPGSAVSFWRAAREYLRDCFGHAYYRWYFVAWALSWMAVAPPSTFGVYFAKSIDMDMAAYGKCYALMYLISLALALPIGFLADRVHPLRLGLAAQVLFAAVTLWGGLFARDVPTFSFALVAQGVLAGTWMTATASLHQHMLPKAKYAQFASAAGILTSLGTIAVGPAVGLLLDRSGHVYRYIFLSSFVLAALALVCGYIVYQRFLALGGPAAYTAPE
jgi:MFS family permease